MPRLSLIFLFVLLTLLPLHAQWLLEYEQEIPVIKEGVSLPLAWAGGLNSGQYYNLDIDRDGQQDLIIFDRTSEQFQPFLSVNDTFMYAPEYSLLFPSTISAWVVFADYDGDGKQDLFTASGKRSITVYRNTSEAHLSWELVADPVATLGFSGFQVAIQVNATDIPAISDIDNDGDLDIVVYNVNGRGNLEYYRNQSQEQYGNATTLEYVAEDREWGSVLECDCSLFAFGEATCADVGARGIFKQAKLEHIGGKSLLAFDADGDGDKDLLTSDEGCGVLYYLENVGSVNEARFESFSTDFPEDLAPGLAMSFPAAYYVDVTHDGTRDLVVAPNTGADVTVTSDMTASSWLYENAGTEAQPRFEFRKRDFLQEAMLDVGTNASPTLADYDADGDLDLFIGQRGSTGNEIYAAGITLYENTGTSDEPTFTFQTDDYLNLRSLQLQRLNIYFEDINEDGFPDLILSGAEGPFVSKATFFYLLNQAVSPGEAWAFVLENQQLLNLDFHPEDQLAFHDMDQDGDQDVFVAKLEGNLEYYENRGNWASPDWQLVSENAGDISSSIFKRDLSVLLHDFDGDNIPDLLSSDASGVLSFRQNFVEAFRQEEVNPDTAAIFFKGESRNVKVSQRTWLAVGKLDNSSKTYVLTGSPQGGIHLLRYNPESKINESGLLLYPNPVNAFHPEVNVQSSEKITHLQLISADGSVIWDQQIDSEISRVSLNTTGLAAGIYLVRAWQASGQVSTAKLMVQ